jgi:hypothetical protein
MMRWSEHLAPIRELRHAYVDKKTSREDDVEKS